MSEENSNAQPVDPGTPTPQNEVPSADPSSTPAPEQAAIPEHQQAPEATAPQPQSGEILCKEHPSAVSSDEPANATAEQADKDGDNKVPEISPYELEVTGNKKLRKDTDAIIQRIKDLPASRERSLAITKLQEGVMWLGMDLKRLGEANPYPSSKAPETGTKIEPTADDLKL